MSHVIKHYNESGLLVFAALLNEDILLHKYKSCFSYTFYIQILFQVYQQNHDEDSFLYIMYSDESVYGH